MAQERGTSSPASSSNSNRDKARTLEFAKAALTGLLANRSYDNASVARTAADIAEALTNEFSKRGL